MESGVFIDELSDYQLLEKGSTAWSWLRTTHRSILRAAFLVATRSVRPREGRRAGVLLTVKKTSGRNTVIMNDFPLLTCCGWLCWTCLCWRWPLLTCVTARNTMSKWS
jgi:hypothetical protein